MSLQIERLSKEVLNSYVNTRSFLEGRSTIVEIAKQRDLFLKQPLYFASQHRNPSRCWRIIHILTYPIRLIISIYIRLLGYLISPLRPRTNRIAKLVKTGFRNFPAPTKTYSYAIGPCNPEERNHFPAPKIAKSSSRTRVSLLNTCDNEPREELSSLASHPPIKITDSRLQKRTFRIDKDHLSFPTGGLCRGMTHWFVYLYLQTKHLYAQPKRHMDILCEIFANGAPLEAVLLQGLFINKGKILNCSFGEEDIGWPKPALKIALTKTKGNRQIINPALVEKELGNLKIGAYVCHFPTHAIAYIKTSSQLSYWFDPNLGVVEIRGPAQGAKVFACLNDPLYFGNKKEESTPAIELSLVELRECAPHIGSASSSG